MAEFSSSSLPEDVRRNQMRTQVKKSFLSHSFDTENCFRLQKQLRLNKSQICGVSIFGPGLTGSRKNTIQTFRTELLLCSGPISTMLKRAGKKVRKKLLTLSEVYCEYICYSDHCFSPDEKTHFMILYNSVHVHIRAYESVRIASKLVSVCIQLAHFPSQKR